MVNPNHTGHILNQRKKGKMTEKYTMKHLNAPKTTPPGFFLDKKFIWKAIDYDPLKDKVTDDLRFARLGVSSWGEFRKKKFKYFAMWMKEWLHKQGKQSKLEKCTVREIDDWLYYTYWTEKNRGETKYTQKQAFIEEWLYENDHAWTLVDLREIMLKEVREIDKRYDLTQVEYVIPERPYVSDLLD